jgi:hypothetical protein
MKSANSKGSPIKPPQLFPNVREKAKRNQSKLPKAIPGEGCVKNEEYIQERSSSCGTREEEGTCKNLHDRGERVFSSQQTGLGHSHRRNLEKDECGRKEHQSNVPYIPTMMEYERRERERERKRKRERD